MGDAYWNRQAPMHQSAGLLKRPRSDYGTALDITLFLCVCVCVLWAFNVMGGVYFILLPGFIYK